MVRMSFPQTCLPQLSSIETNHYRLATLITRLLSLLPPSHIQQLATIFPHDQFPHFHALLASAGHVEVSQISSVLHELHAEAGTPKPNFIGMVRNNSYMYMYVM